MFFEKIVWGIWTQGRSRKACETFLDRSIDAGFQYDYRWLSGLNDNQFGQFITRLHGSMCPGRPKKWFALREIARVMDRFRNETEFREDFFLGITESSQLTRKHAEFLIDKKVSFIGPATAFYTIKNIGGEAIKQDIWINRFLVWIHLDLIRLERLLDDLGIPLGLFDTVLWSYCEKFVTWDQNLDNEFDLHFLQSKPD